MTTTSPTPPKNNPKRAGFKLSAARLAAVQSLYEIEISGAKTEAVLTSILEKQWRDLTLVDPDLNPDEAERAKLANPDPAYLTKIVEGVTGERARITAELDHVLTGEWTSGRLDTLMRALLCAAAFELMFEAGVPKRVVISEYTDLAHAFYADNEASFAVGILGALAARVRPE